MKNRDLEEYEKKRTLIFEGLFNKFDDKIKQEILSKAQIIARNNHDWGGAEPISISSDDLEEAGSEYGLIMPNAI